MGFPPKFHRYKVNDRVVSPAGWAGTVTKVLEKGVHQVQRRYMVRWDKNGVVANNSPSVLKPLVDEGIKMGPFENEVECLTEFMDRPYDMSRKNSGRVSRYDFKTDGRQEYSVVFDAIPLRLFLANQNTPVDSILVLYRMFGLHIPSTQGKGFWINNLPNPEEIVDIEFENTTTGQNHFSKFGITGAGAAETSRILGTVVTAIKSYIASESPDVFYFSAKETSRRKLYQHMVQRFKLAEYETRDLGKGVFAYVKKSVLSALKRAAEAGLKEWERVHEHWTV